MSKRTDFMNRQLRRLGQAIELLERYHALSRWEPPAPRRRMKPRSKPYRK